MSAKLLHQALLDNQLRLTQNQEHQLLRYLELLQQWNQVFNLTAIRDPEAMIFLHIVDSLVIHPFLHGKKILDVGTGAGLPGIPLAILDSERHFTLLDSNSKKVRFLTQVKLELQLNNVEIIHARSEEFHPASGFDSIVSRAFASIANMLQVTEHLICPQGKFLAMKGVVPEDEIAAIPEKYIANVHMLNVHGIDAARCVVCIAQA